VTERVLSAVDTGTPNVARVYDYILGGKDNFAADREAAKQVLAAIPEAREAVQEGRAYLGRVVEYLAGEAGIRQFLDIGSGLPTQRNVHEVAQAVAPNARVVYVDNDPVVCAHGRALLEDGTRVAVVEADLRRPEEILANPATQRLIDFNQPVGVLLVAILHLISDDDDPFAAVAALRDMLAPGSYLVINHLLDTEERHSDTSQAQQVYSRSNAGLYPRTHGEVLEFLCGLELLDENRFVSPEVRERYAAIGWGAVARKP
jgi:hypothetical protein